MTGSADAASTELAELARDADWRRLDARMLLVHPVNELVRFLPALVGVFLIGNSGDNGHAWWHAAAVAVPVLVGLLRFLTTSFRITASQLELRRGLISRNVLTAPLDRVRTVELTSSPIHRALGLAKVQIGTGSAQKRGDGKLVLDSLAATESRTLRAALLHRAGGQPATGVASTPDAPTPAATSDEVLLRLDPRWVRYAPLTTGGLAIALAALAAGNQLVTPLVTDAVQHYRLDDRTTTVPWWLAIVAALVAFVVVISVLSVLGYVLTNWGFTLSRDTSGRSFHVTRGLFTNRETSLETQRIRGVEVHEPLGLRLAGAARLTAIVTGLSRREAGSTALVPPAPAGLVAAVARRTVDDDAPFLAGLSGHGAAAGRRRYSRAILGGTVAGVAMALLDHALGLRDWPQLVAVLPVLLAWPLAHDRARRLGHALTDHHLVVRAHSLRGRRDVLQRSGVIGWNIRQSWFQRRAGLVTLVATTSAGKQGYRVLDVPEPEALRLADAVAPGLLDEFWVPAQTSLR